MQTLTFTIFPSNETAIVGKIAQLKVCILNSVNSLNVIWDVLKEKVLPSMALSENVGHLVHTVGYDLISIGALNRDDSEAMKSMLFHGVTKVNLSPPESAERTFRWAWCCGNDGQNRSYLRELWCNFIEGVFVQYVNDICRLLHWFSTCVFWNDWKRVGLHEVAPCRNYSNHKEQLGHF